MTTIYNNPFPVPVIHQDIHKDDNVLNDEASSTVFFSLFYLAKCDFISLCVNFILSCSNMVESIPNYQ